MRGRLTELIRGFLALRVVKEFVICRVPSECANPQTLPLQPLLVWISLLSFDYLSFLLATICFFVFQGL